jgi:hypothetical protein
MQTCQKCSNEATGCPPCFCTWHCHHEGATVCEPCWHALFAQVELCHTFANPDPNDDDWPYRGSSYRHEGWWLDFMQALMPANLKSKVRVRP